MPPICVWLLIAVSALIPSELLGLNDNERLGDSVISERASKAFFDKLDNNDNGMLSVEEFQKFIKDTGGNALDENSEIQSAVANVLISLDDNADKIIKKKDLAAFWVQQASLLSVKDSADWARHSMHMPEDVVQIFLSNAVTGYDFPELMENEGELIETELGITRKNLKRRLLRGMIMRFTGMGSMPDTPTSFNGQPSGCLEVKLSWDKFRTSDVYFPVHKYLVERFQPDNRGQMSSSSPGAHWVAVYGGTGTDAIDSVHASGLDGANSELLVYRISAWNAIGRSEYAEKKLILPYEHIHCEAHRRLDNLPLDYLVGSHGGRIKSETPLRRPWANYPLYYFGVLSFVSLLIALIGYYLVGLIGDVDDCIGVEELSTIRSILCKARRLFRNPSTYQDAVAVKNGEPIYSPGQLNSGIFLESTSSGYDSDSVSTNFTVDTVTVVSSMTSGTDLGSTAGHKKSSKWNMLRDKVNNKSFSKLFRNGRNSAQPIPAMPLIDEHEGVKSVLSAGIATRAVPTTASSGIAAEDIFRNDDSIGCDKPVRKKSTSSNGDLSLAAPVPFMKNLPRTRSFGDNITGSPKDAESNSELPNEVQKDVYESREKIIDLTDVAIGRVSPTIREKGKYCMQCNRSFSFGRRMKHRCGKCNESFCGECSFKIAHVFALPCKIPSQCICKKCGV